MTQTGQDGQMKIGASGEGTKVPASGEIGVKAISEEDLDISKWKTYRNEEYGFEFKYPESIFELNADVSANDTLVIDLVRKFDIHRGLAEMIMQINLYESKTKRIALPRGGVVDFLGKKGRILSFEVHVPDEMKAYYSIVNNGTCNHGGTSVFFGKDISRFNSNLLNFSCDDDPLTGKVFQKIYQSMRFF